MRWLDWIVVVVYLVWIVGSGLRASRRTNELDGYFRANRSLPWWAVGLSVMATQLSAITLVGTTGQAYADGMRFVQFYFGLPIAMVILSIAVVPFFYRSGVYTAYEYLERRFDVKTRTLAAAIFLAQRGLSCGVIIAAPAIIFSIVLGWNIFVTILLIGLPTIAYTMVGGVQAVTWTDVKQMAVVLGAMVTAVVVLIVGLPKDVSARAALHVAGAVGRLQAIDFRFDPKQTYTIWSGLIGGLFLSLSYFGTDQSQVQRYLTAKSLTSSRHSLLLSAFVKIPLQTLILLTGVFVFAFFLFNRAPMLFNTVHEREVLASPRAAEYQALEGEFQQKYATRRAAAEALAQAEEHGPGSPGLAEARAAFRQADADVAGVRGRAVALVREISHDESYTELAQRNYVFPTFILTYMPMGLVGLMIAAIISAAMSASSGELNALATASVMDFYRRHIRPGAPDETYLIFSKFATAFWGLFACGVAYFAANLGSLIEVVNKFGSLFYGSMLGVFILALGVRRANGHGAFAGLIAGLVTVFVFAFHPATKDVSYLWHNVIGAVVCVVVGIAVSLIARPAAR
ncbi:MAG TPA: sodium:solute symporter [Vicinamibacterales bacterium]|nr:sodium:solute symporter [Vicinamibacterales bacterium]